MNNDNNNPLNQNDNEWQNDGVSAENTESYEYHDENESNSPITSSNELENKEEIQSSLTREFDLGQQPQNEQPSQQTNGQYNGYQTGDQIPQNNYYPYMYNNIPPQQRQQQPPQQPQRQQQPPQQPPQSSQQFQQPQTQWTFNDYGPINNMPPKSPKKKKQKKEKKPHSANFGIKIFAVVMSVMFLLSVSSLAGYIVYDQNNVAKDSVNINSSSNPGEKDNDINTPSLDIGKTPNVKGDIDKDGVLSTREINKKVSESVVGVAVYAKTTGYQLVGQGSGIIMSKDGYVITNAHVVSNQSNNVKIEKIEVIVSSGATYAATLVGGELKTDLAVLKINAQNLVPAEFGDSDKLEIGDRVIVIGNPSGLALAGTLTQGVVSALNRDVYMSELGANMQYIQTDAAINPGNSGGAFINEYGQVVGISSAKLTATDYEGIGFAIPINNAKDVIDSIIKNGYVVGRPKIGIGYTPVGEALAKLNGLPNGLRVGTIEEDSDAFKKGIQISDIIFKMDGKETYDAATIAAVLDPKKPGDKVTLTVYRVDISTGKSSTFEVVVVLGEMISEPIN